MGTLKGIVLILLYLGATHAQDCREYLWRCYGQQVAGSSFGFSATSPVSYLDNQDGTVVLNGIVKELEYYAMEADIPVRFMFFQVADIEQGQFTLFDEYTHTASDQGFQKVQLSIPMPAGVRIGFEVTARGRCPIPFEYSNGNYNSFENYNREGDLYVFPTRSIEKRYQFRVCNNVTSYPVGCPTEPPITAPPPTPPTPSPPPLTTPAPSDCIEYLWRCYGPQVSGRAFGRYSIGPLTYLDNQDGTIILNGIVKELEYHAWKPDIPVRFLFFQIVDINERIFSIFDEYTHTATNAGFQKIQLDYPMPKGIRIGFQIADGNECPIPFEHGRESGDKYDSYTEYTMIGDNFKFSAPSVNKRYQFRVCNNVTQIPTGCPTEAPVTRRTTTPPTPPPITTGPPGCITRTVDIGKFGQGVPRINGVLTQRGGPYSMIDIDGAAEMPDGIITGIEYRVWKLEKVTLQIWRPLDIVSGSFRLIYSLELEPAVAEQVLEVTQLNMPIQNKDRWGFSYAGTTDVPVKYSVTLNEPNQEDYMALECFNCGAVGATVGSQVSFPTTKVQKQFRMRACMIQTVTECNTLPPIIDCTPACSHSLSNQNRLREDILCDKYNSESIPLFKYSDKLNVRLHISLKAMHFDDGMNVLKVTAIMTEMWRDYALGWCKDDYAGLSQMRISGKHIWTPDITPVNGEMTEDEVRCDKATLSSNGDLERPLYVHFGVPCKLMNTFSDSYEYSCQQQFASWMYDDDQLNIEAATLDPTSLRMAEGLRFVLASLSDRGVAHDSRSVVDMMIQVRIDI